LTTLVYKKNASDMKYANSYQSVVSEIETVAEKY